MGAGASKSKASSALVVATPSANDEQSPNLFRIEAAAEDGPSTSTQIAVVPEEAPQRRLSKKASIAQAKEFDWSKKKVDTVPPALHSFKQVEKVNLSWNFIKAIPNRLCSTLLQLRELHIPYNKLEKLPESIGNLRELRVIDIQSNNIAFLPDSFVLLEKLEILFAAKNVFLQFPRELKGLQMLHTLDLGQNKIGRVGRTLGTLKNLQHVSLAHNQIRIMPEEVGRLKYLQTIDMSHNLLKTLPKEFGRCSKLQFIDVSHNMLWCLPKELCECQVLQMLYCQHNKLADLPPTLCYIRNLRRLNASDNEIMMIYGPVHFWVNLQSLDLSNNKLLHLPVDIGQLPLLDLHLHGNEELRIPDKALEGGTTSLLCYIGTVGAQHKMMFEYMDNLAFKSSDASRKAEQESSKEVGAAMLEERFGVGGAGGAIAGSTSGAIVPVSEEERNAMHAQVQRTREWLEENPHRAHLAMTMKQRQQHFKKSVEFTRQLLAKKGMEYGNTHVNIIQKAKYSGVLNMKSTNLKAVPPEVGRLDNLKIADLRLNVLAALEEHVTMNASLSVLDSSYNKIEKIADSINLPNLKVLCLAFNRLRALPDAIGDKAKELEVLYLSGNFLTELPPSFADLQVRDLYASENRFHVFPSPVLGMAQLTKLSISCNSLSYIPPQIVDLVNLQFLDISFNNIKELPSNFGSLPSLERLNAGFNPLGPELPAGLCALEKLVELNLDFSNIETLPHEFGNMTSLEGIQLEGNPLQHPYDAMYRKSPDLLVQFLNVDTEVLDLSECGIEEIPNEIGRLERLHNLDLSNNRIKKVPLAVGLLYNLVTFSLEGNPLVSPYRELRREPYGDLSIVAFLDAQALELDLTSCSFQEIPDLFSRHAEELQILNLSDNLLYRLPEYMATFQNLRCLVMDNNRFKDFPEVVCMLKNLETLSISKTQIDSVPPQIADLKGLKRLVLDSNDIVELPKTLVLLTNLDFLKLSNNKIKELPLSIGNLTQLRVLDVACNDIKALPPSLCDLLSMEVLDAKINELDTVPEELGDCESLRYLNLSNNAIDRLPSTLSRLTDLEGLGLAANQLTRLPYDMLDLENLEEIQLFGNPMPNVSSILNVKGNAPCKYLMAQLKATLYPRGKPEESQDMQPKAKRMLQLAGINEE